MRYFAELAFKGTAYHGWQIQQNAMSVQEVFNKALSIVLRHEVETIGCGRTDTGVHAKQLFAHFDSYVEPNINIWVISLNSLLPKDIVVRRIFSVSPAMHARFDAISRSYEYRMHFTRDPFYHGLSTFMRYMPDFEKMNEAAGLLSAFSDFSCFSKSRTQVKTNICRIEHAKWQKEGDQWVFSIKADRFLRNMVRAVVGTLLEVGKDELSIPGFIEVIKSGDRGNAGISVPAEGLYLCHIEYAPIAQNGKQIAQNGK